MEGDREYRRRASCRSSGGLRKDEPMSIQSINPATGEVLETFAPTSRYELDRILAAAHAAFLEWRAVPMGARAKQMREAASALRRRKADYARTMTREMGKPIVQGEAEVEKCAWVCDYYAEQAAGFLAEQPRETDASKSYVRFDPLGVVLAVMPWNFPFWQVFRFAAPALMDGNGAVHRRRDGGGPVHRAVRRRASFPPHGRSSGARDPGGSTGARGSQGRASSPGRGVDQARGQATAGW